jgi:poly(A) polymerase
VSSQNTPEAPGATPEASEIAQLEPRIIPRPEHNLSRKNIDPDALKVLYRLHRHGFKAYLVGGGVRDLLIGKRPKDFDISTDALPKQVYKLFGNSRIIGRRFRLVQVFFRGGKIIEVSTFRKASPSNGDDQEVLGANNTFGTAAEDAMRRDLTINAMFYNIADYSIVDYVGGLDDLRHSRVRAVGDPMVRFMRDPVRVMRAVRHAARAGFNLTDDTVEAIREHRDKLELCPESRVRDELLRDLKGGASAKWLQLAHETGVLYSLLPTLKHYYAEDDSPLRRQAGELLGKVDRLLKSGVEVDDSVAACCLFWPIVDILAESIEFPPGKPGRGRWVEHTRTTLPELAAPVMFAKRMMERSWQIGGVMCFLREGMKVTRLPKKVIQKGYFPIACQLAEILGGDLASLAKPAPNKKRRRRRPRRRSKGRAPAQKKTEQS